MESSYLESSDSSENSASVVSSERENSSSIESSISSVKQLSVIREDVESIEEEKKQDTPKFKQEEIKDYWQQADELCNANSAIEELPLQIQEKKIWVETKSKFKQEEIKDYWQQADELCNANSAIEELPQQIQE